MSAANWTPSRAACITSRSTSTPGKPGTGRAVDEVMVILSQVDGFRSFAQWRQHTNESASGQHGASMVQRGPIECRLIISRQSQVENARVRHCRAVLHEGRHGTASNRVAQ